jgi:hypothetical protein
MPDYTKTIIYKICCVDNEIDDIYVGSTTDFARRKYNHKSNVSNPRVPRVYNCPVYRCIRENGGWSNWVMRVVTEVSCENRHEAEHIEREYVELLGATLNGNVPARSMSDWYQDNKEYKKAYLNQHYQAHREEYKEKARIKRAQKKSSDSV